VIEDKDNRWRRLLTIHGEDGISPDSLLSDAQGRYLALRITLGGEGTASPRLRRIKITYPHESYLRYLPAIYQEDPIGRDITDRFMSLFESFNMDMEEEIRSITRLFDPLSTRKDFLPWLASWFGIVQDENWPEQRFREFLSRSYSLFKIRGTIEGLNAVISLYTGKTAKIIEHFRYLRPMVLGNEIRVGLTSVVGRKFTSQLVIEETSTIGDFKLIEEVEPPEMPFIVDAYDFTIVIDGSKDQQKGLVRLIDSEKPAHTNYRLHLSKEGAPRIGCALLGMDTRMAHANQPIYVGDSSLLGTDSFVGDRFPMKGLYGAKSQVEISTYLH
jgi:phage tail-like protein